MRKSYLPPDICCVSLTDGHTLMETSIGRFEDIEYGGDLGGDGWGQGDVDGRTDYGGGSGDGWNQGDADNRQDYGGGGSGSKATTFGDVLWNKEFEELVKF